MRVLQEWTLVGRLFQRKPRAPNEMLQRVTDRSLAEADLRVSDLVQLYTPCRNMECTAGPDHLELILRRCRLHLCEVIALV